MGMRRDEGGRERERERETPLLKCLKFFISAKYLKNPKVKVEQYGCRLLITFIGKADLCLDYFFKNNNVIKKNKWPGTFVYLSL